MLQKVMSRISVKLLCLTVTKNCVGGTRLRCVSENFRQLKSFWTRGVGVSSFSVEKVFSQSAEKISRVTLQGVTIFGYLKFLCSREVCHDFCREFFVSQYRNISQGNLSVLCFRKLPAAIKFMHRRRRGLAQGVSRFSLKKFLSDSAKKKQENRGSLLCCVFEKSRQQKVFRQERGGSIKFLLRKIFSSHSVEKCRRGFLQSFNNFGYGESLEVKVRGGEYQDFPLQVSCLAVPKKYIRQPFRVSLISVIEDFYAPDASVTIFCRNFVSHSDKKIRTGTLLCCVSENFRQQKNLWIRRGGISRFSVENFLSDSAEKFRSGNIQCVINFGYRKNLCFRRLFHDFPSNFFVSQ